MNPADFLRTIYLGDRACKAVTIDGWRNEVKVQIDCISRVRGEAWNFYNDENLEDGFLVFEGVSRVSLSPEGWLPNDAIFAARSESSR